VVSSAEPGSSPARIESALNWYEELERLVPARD
jgi:hypothetical protein